MERHSLHNFKVIAEKEESVYLRIYVVGKIY